MSENDTLVFGGFTSPAQPGGALTGRKVENMDYKKLYEKHARSLKQRGYIVITSGVINIVAGFLMLKQHRDEQQ